ncbi:MAG: carboxypeptidase-like regulatory domain-containing protein [Vicingaceae bacterium]
MIYSSLCFSQENTKVIVLGLVVDTNNNSVANTNITTPNTSVGTTTNKDGVFYLSLNKDAAYIQVSHINYYPKTIPLNFDNTISDTLKLNIFLVPKINQLESFEISSKKNRITLS